jgi:hypothetical protein
MKSFIFDHTGRFSGQGRADTQNLKPMLGERFTTPDSVQKKELISKKIKRPVLT